MSAYTIGGGTAQRQTVIIGDADKSGEADLLELPAHGENDRGNPVKIGGRVSAAPFADVADGKRTDAWFSTNGQLGVMNVVEPTVVYDSARRSVQQFFVFYNPLTTATLIPGAAGLQTKVLGITATANGAAPGQLSLTDGTTTLLMIDNFNGIGSRRVGYGPFLICQTPVNTPLVITWSGAANQFWVSLNYYQA